MIDCAVQKAPKVEVFAFEIYQLCVQCQTSAMRLEGEEKQKFAQETFEMHVDLLEDSAPPALQAAMHGERLVALVTERLEMETWKKFEPNMMRSDRYVK